jgi:hypothetical protein
VRNKPGITAGMPGEIFSPIGVSSGMMASITAADVN